ncbi:MAG: glycosyl hydrolase 115 family protein [Sedimentisphaerales bacterium]
MRKTALTAIVSVLYLFSLCSCASAVSQQHYVDTAFNKGDFVLSEKDQTAILCVDANDWAGVIRAVNDLQADVNRVTDKLAEIKNEIAGKNAILIGTIGKSKIIDKLIADGKIDAKQITGKWESFIIEVVPQPLAGVENALVIAGSDKRGTIYGIYDLSQQIGVSPWFWWADVPVEHKDAVFVKAGKYQQGEPVVKYRGIFLNDEAPALTGYVLEKYGDYNSKFYAKVFELLLRLKGNYLWPAMWNNAFNEDDKLNAKLADEYGIVMGTSHQEPMLRAQKEWDRRHSQHWNYYTDANTLKEFWRDGIKRNKNYESIITMGLRGANDTEMVPNGTVQQCMALLKEIIDVQRKIIADEVNSDVTKVPQLWCPYKEVLDYYNAGFRVPDDITILWTDDNWGNIRRLPTADERKRSGGAGVYYHFDYHGGPRSYEWLNTTQIARVWEQMNLAVNYGATKIWIVNVGDLKPLEFPIEFFIDFGFNPQNWPKEKISEYTKLWAEREFGPKNAAEIADIVSKYTKYNARRKTELLDPTTFNVVNYGEADRVSAEWKEIVDKAEKIYAGLPENAKDAFFQLVLYPTKASAQVTNLYIAAAKNNLYARQIEKRATANDMAAQTRELFAADANLSYYYNHTMAGGKWNHIMDAIHIGWTAWNPPPKNNMPYVKDLDIPAEANMGVAIEGSMSVWPDSKDEAILPAFDIFNQQKRYIDIFNRGKNAIVFLAEAKEPWIMISRQKYTNVDKELRIFVSIDWDKAPAGEANGLVKISDANGKEVNIIVKVFNPAEPNKASLEGFVEADGYVSIEAEHYSKKVDAGQVRWEKIDDLGRTLSAMSIFPVTAESVTPPKDSPCLEYKMYLFHAGPIEVESIVSPTLNFVPGRGLRYAVSFDDEQPQIIELVPANFIAQHGNMDWEKTVADSVRYVKSTHTISQAGFHTLKIWMVDPAVVLQKIVVNTGGLKPSYLGPPESYRGAAK